MNNNKENAMHQQKELNRLRHLLLGEDEKTIAEVRHWFKNPDYQSKGMSEVLADAIKMADHDNAPALSAALKHPVEEAVKHTIKDEPEAFFKSAATNDITYSKVCFSQQHTVAINRYFCVRNDIHFGIGISYLSVYANNADVGKAEPENRTN